MKKLFLLTSLLLGMALAAQTVPAYPTIKLTKPANGTKNDSIVVRNNATGGILKILPVSEIKGTTDLSQAAIPTGINVFSSTGTDITLPLATGTNAGVQSPADKTKLDGIATGATANQTDAYLLARENHTGTQAIATVTGLQSALDTKVDKVAGERLINAGEITKLSNQSGTNTGDQDLSGLVVKNASITAATNTKITYDSKGLVTGGTNAGIADIIGLQTALDAKISTTSINANNGVAPLDAGGKVPFANLPASLMIYKGMWNPATNTPTLANGTGTAGWVYKASVDGTANLGSGSISFLVGDFVIHNGTAWERSVGTDNVVSVNGQQGVVNLTTANIADSSNKRYQTDAQNANNDATSSIQTQLNTKANDALVVHSTGNETLGGIKTFSSIGTFNLGARFLRPSGGYHSISARDDGINVSMLSVTHSLFFNNTTNRDYTFPNASGTLALTSDLAAYEPAFSKNTAFNKNFGTTAGTVAEGNDSRILNGQTAYFWGNHAGLYPSFTGSGASGTWNIKANDTQQWRGYENDWNSTIHSDNPDYLLTAKGAMVSKNTVGSIQSWLGLNTGSTLTNNITGSSGTADYAYRLHVLDNRGGDRAPNYYSSFKLQPFFNDLVPGMGGWASGINISGWSNSDYQSWQLIGGSDPSALNRWYLRSGVGASWNSMNEIIHSNNVASYALPLTGGTVTGEIESTYRFKAPGLFIGYWDGANNRIESTSRPLAFTSYGSGNDIRFGFDGAFNTFVLKQSSGKAGFGTGDIKSGKLDVVSSYQDNTPSKANSTAYFNNLGCGVYLGGRGYSYGYIQAEQTDNTLQKPLYLNPNGGSVNIADLSGTGTRTLVADASGNLSATATPPGTRPYKVYTALISQSGTSAPTATVLENNLGGTVTYSYNAVGVFIATLSGAFTSAKTACFIHGDSDADETYGAKRINNNEVWVWSRSFGTTGNGILQDATFEIRVYNFMLLLVPYSMIRRRKRKLINKQK